MKWGDKLHLHCKDKYLGAGEYCKCKGPEVVARRAIVWVIGNKVRELAGGQNIQELIVYDKDFHWLDCKGKSLEGFEYGSDKG